jgi:hypothetical protein
LGFGIIYLKSPIPMLITDPNVVNIGRNCLHLISAYKLLRRKYQCLLRFII